MCCFGNAFDFNFDGKVTPDEELMGFMMMSGAFDAEDETEEEDDQDEDSDE